MVAVDRRVVQDQDDLGAAASSGASPVPSRWRRMLQSCCSCSPTPDSTSSGRGSRISTQHECRRFARQKRISFKPTWYCLSSERLVCPRVCMRANKEQRRMGEIRKSHSCPHFQVVDHLMVCDTEMFEGVVRSCTGNCRPRGSWELCVGDVLYRANCFIQNTWSGALLREPLPHSCSNMFI